MAAGNACSSPPQSNVRVAAVLLRMVFGPLKLWVRVHGAHDPAGLATQALELLDGLAAGLEKNGRRSVTGGPSTDAVQAALCDATGSIPGDPVIIDDEDDEESLAERIAQLESWGQQLLENGNYAAHAENVKRLNSLQSLLRERQRPLVLTGPGGDFTTAHHPVGNRMDALA